VVVSVGLAVVISIDEGITRGLIFTSGVVCTVGDCDGICEADADGPIVISMENVGFVNACNDDPVGSTDLVLKKEEGVGDGPRAVIPSLKKNAGGDGVWEGDEVVNVEDGSSDDIMSSDNDVDLSRCCCIGCIEGISVAVGYIVFVSTVTTGDDVVVLIDNDGAVVM